MTKQDLESTGAVFIEEDTISQKFKLNTNDGPISLWKGKNEHDGRKDMLSGIQYGLVIKNFNELYGEKGKVLFQGPCEDSARFMEILGHMDLTIVKD